MAYSDIIKTREDSQRLPETWYRGIEKSREKAKRFLKQVIAIDQNTSVVIGRLEGVSTDRLWRLKYPYTKLTMENCERYRTDGKFEFKLANTQICFVNKPEMIMSMEELAKRFPNIYEEVLGKIKKDEYG